MRRSQLSIFVLPTETAAFQAYRLLQAHGISPEHLAIVGEGYSSPEHVGLLKPMQIATRKAWNLAIFSGTLGSTVGLGLTYSLGTRLDSLSNLNLLLMPLAVGVIAGFCGAVVGALSGWLGEGNNAGIYRHYLAQGKYLLMIEGPEKLVRRGQDVLSYYSAPRT